ncbi:hypothetical protein ACVBAX_14830 [Robertmurraya sp. GLU-23]
MCYKTTIILGKDTSQMRLNDIIEELVYVIEQKGNIETENRKQNCSELDKVK